MVDSGTGAARGDDEPDAAPLRRDRITAAIEYRGQRLPVLRRRLADPAATHPAVARTRARIAPDRRGARPRQERTTGARGAPGLAAAGAGSPGTADPIGDIHD